MAKVIGTSQAWSYIVEALASRSLTINKIDDLRKLLNRKKLDYEKAKEDATKSFDDKLDQAVRNLDNTEADFQGALEFSKKECDSQIELLEDTIWLLQDERWIVRRIINSPKIRDYKKQIERIKARHNKYVRDLEASILKKQRDIRFRKSNRDACIESECQEIKEDITKIEQILASQWLAGAVAELELIELLRKLPENFYVINDVELSLSEGVLFDGKWLQTAQIDHLVVSPAGIFVIEAKSWSKEFIEHGDYFDPHQQVKRSRYVCYKFLQDKLQGAKIRSIIAYKGAIPEKPNDSYVKVLRFREVNGYITWFKDNHLSDQQIRSLVECIE